MDNTIIALLSGLSGSLITVVAQKLIDVFQDSKKQKYLLQKTYFDRKLAAAEKASGQFSLLLTSFLNLATVYENIPDMDEDNLSDVELNRQLMEQNQAILHRASDASYELANSIFIYFDIDESTFWDGTPMKSLRDKMSESEVISGRLDSLYQYYDSVKDSDQEDYALEQIEIAEDQMKNCFMDMVDVFNNAKNVYLKILRDMRAEMKKFEP